MGMAGELGELVDLNKKKTMQKEFKVGDDVVR